MKRTRALWPNARLALLCRKGLGEFFRQAGLVDEVLEVRKGEASSYRQARGAAGGVDLVISPHSSFRTALWVWRLGAAHSVGYRAPWTSWAFSRTVSRDAELPDALRQLQLLAPMDPELALALDEYRLTGVPNARDGEGRVSPVPAWASMSLAGAYDARADQWSELARRVGLADEVAPLALIFPGSVWATKRWTLESFASVGRELVKRGARVVVMGGPGEESIATALASQVPGALDLAGKTSLFESALLIRRAKVVIGNDSASIHLAASAETPTIAIFGPTIPEFGFRPWQDRAWIVQREGLACRPCGPHGHRVCPRGTHECMTELGPQSVSRLAARLL